MITPLSKIFSIYFKIFKQKMSTSQERKSRELFKVKVINLDIFGVKNWRYNISKIKLVFFLQGVENLNPNKYYSC